MEEIEDSKSVFLLLKSKIEKADEMLTKCSTLHVEGIIKLRKKIKAEINFLLKLQSGNRVVKKEHLLCSNLIQLEALLDTLFTFPQVTSILKPFHSTSGRILVDMVADNGLIWVKVIARNPQAMYQISLGQGQFGEKSIIDHANDYLQFSAQNPVNFVPPKIIFIFTNGVFLSVMKTLEEMNVHVKGEILLDVNKPLKFHRTSENLETDSTTSNLKNCSPIKTPLTIPLNLDVTTMLAYVSSLTNGNCWFRFKEKVLDYQANCERLKPVKPQLDSLFEGRRLVCCQTAKTDFDNIVSTLGGENEKKRAQILLEKIQVLSDCVSKRVEDLPLSSQIKKRSKVIFGSGDYYQAVTVTANTGFVRSSASKGLNLAVYIHESRALTEAKETNAEPVKH